MLQLVNKRLSIFLVLIVVLTNIEQINVAASELSHQNEGIIQKQGSHSPVEIPQQPKQRTPITNNHPFTTTIVNEMDVCRKNPNHHTIQLVAGGSEIWIVDFIGRKSWNQSTGYVKTSFNGKPWFVVLYGDFPLRDSANKVLDIISTQKLANAPWIRTFADLQKMAGGCTQTNDSDSSPPLRIRL